MKTKKIFVKFLGLWLLTGCLSYSLQGQSAARREALIIDHRCTDISQIPPEYIEQAKAKLRIAYGHTSHGSQLISGMSALQNANPKLYAFGKNNQGLWLVDRTPKGDLGNPDRTTWAGRTREYLNGPGKDENVIIWSW